MPAAKKTAGILYLQICLAIQFYKEKSGRHLNF